MSAPMRVIHADRDLSADEARDLTREIQQAVAGLELLLVRAYQGRAWLALGYESWDWYIEGEFKAAPLALPREERRAASQSLAAWGLSTRAIASTTGVSEVTARRDSQVRHFDAPDSDHLAPPETPRTNVTGLDGKTYTRRPQPRWPTPVLTREEQEHRAAVRRSRDRLLAFLHGFLDAYALAHDQDPDRDEVLSALDDYSRNRLLHILKETQWPSTRI